MQINYRYPYEHAFNFHPPHKGMLLLELGAQLNSKDIHEYTPAAWAEAQDHFPLMDRLVMLGGKGHGLMRSSANNARGGHGRG